MAMSYERDYKTPKRREGDMDIQCLSLVVRLVRLFCEEPDDAVMWSKELVPKEGRRK